jgi:hypothetical protein
MRIFEVCEIYLPILRRYRLDARGEPRVIRRINGPVPDRIACGIRSQVVVSLPVSRRPDWPGNESATAVRAYIVQHRVHAVRTERAFVGADSGFRCIRW